MALFRSPLRDEDGRNPMESRLVVAIAAGLCLATLALVWLGYIATREWRRGADLLLERRQAEALALVMAGLARDMTGASTTLIVPANERTIAEDPPFDLQQVTARAFARFPYPESFFIWTTQATGSTAYAFNRTDRPPRWNQQIAANEPFPVANVRNPPGLEPTIDRLRELAGQGSPFVTIDVDFDGVPYQVVAHLLFDPVPPHKLSALAAFTVNLDWVRQEYFEPLLRQIAQIGGNEDVLSFTVTDPRGALVATTVPALGEGKDLRRRFPLLFLEPHLLPAGSDRPADEWTVHVRPSLDNTLLAAQQGTRRTFFLLAIAAAASIIALLLTVHAIQARAVVASMKSDFVSAVTHELKTPLSLIRLVGDTLAGGRYRSPDTVQEYASLLSEEAARLGQSIDNLLTYARYSEPENSVPIEFKPIHLGELLEDALERFRPSLERMDFQLSVNVPAALPPVSADRTSLLHVVENIIDNAIKYSVNGRSLSIVASTNGKYVHVRFEDHGIGIPKEDLGRIFERFFRARNAIGGGSGLGLAIAHRIVRRHGGRIQIRSALNVGTEVDLILPAGDRS